MDKGAAGRVETPASGVVPERVRVRAELIRLSDGDVSESPVVGRACQPSNTYDLP